MDKEEINIRGGFSDRNKLKPLNTTIQYTELDLHSRQCINNLIFKILEELKTSSRMYQSDLGKEIMIKVFNYPVTTDDYFPLDDVSEKLRNICLCYKYDDILSVLEVLCNMADFYEKQSISYLQKRNNCSWFRIANSIFESEFIGYKFVGKIIVKITSKEEISSIESALRTKYENVNLHVSKAISCLRVNGNHDYKNAIKECSLALESLINSVLHTTNLTLGQGIKKYASLKQLHPAFVESISSFYGFVSDSCGIRHDTNNKEFNESFDEAKLVLVNTSAFINYIVSKN